MRVHPACTGGALASSRASPAALAACAVSPLRASALACTEAHASAGLQERGLPHSLPARRLQAKALIIVRLAASLALAGGLTSPVIPADAWQDRAGRAHAGPHPRVEGARRDMEAADLVVQAAVAAVRRQALYDLRAGSTHGSRARRSFCCSRARLQQPGRAARVPGCTLPMPARQRPLRARSRRARTPLRSCCRACTCHCGQHCWRQGRRTLDNQSHWPHSRKMVSRAATEGGRTVYMTSTPARLQLLRSCAQRGSAAATALHQCSLAGA
jgi:hypothetical protein